MSTCRLRDRCSRLLGAQGDARSSSVNGELRRAGHGRRARLPNSHGGIRPAVVSSSTFMMQSAGHMGAYIGRECCNYCCPSGAVPAYPDCELFVPRNLRNRGLLSGKTPVRNIAVCEKNMARNHPRRMKRQPRAKDQLLPMSTERIRHFRSRAISHYQCYVAGAAMRYKLADFRRSFTSRTLCAI